VVIIDTDDVSRNTLSLYFDSGFGLDPIEYSDFKSFRDDFKESLDFSMLAITSDISDSFLDLADCLHSMEQKVPILLFRNKVLSAKELDLLEENCRSLTKLNFPFVENEFLEAMEGIVDDLAESAQKTSPAEIENDPKRPPETNSPPEPKADYSLKKERTEHKEVQADYSLKKERTEQQEVQADYSLKKERTEQQEVDADYSLKKEYSEQQKVDADYSLKKEYSEQQEVDADYSLKKEHAEQQEVDADYSLKKEHSEQQEVDADYSLKKEYSEQQEVDADYSLKKEHAEQQEVDADYSLKKEHAEQQEVDADYSLKKEHAEQQEVDADYSLKKERVEQKEVQADYSLNKMNRVKQKLGDLGVKSSNTRELDEENSKKYVFIKIQKIIVRNKYDFDIFVRLSPKKVIKIINKGDVFVPQDVLKFVSRGITHVIIPSESLSKFQEILISEVLKKTATKNISKEGSLKGLVVVSANLDEYIKSMGITPFAIKAVEEQRKQSVKALKKNKNLADLLNSAMSGNIYLEEHGMLCSLIATEICKQMAWGSDKILQKMHFVSILHDVSLKDGYLAEIHNPKDKSISPEDQKLVLAHPGESSSIVQQADDLPADIDTMILQHHEMPDGSGFPAGLKALSISPLSCVFIISEKIVKEIYGKKHDKEKINNIINQLDESFNRGNFKKPLAAAKKAFS